MVRSMYAGVAGMRAHQTRMDAIGNNISNVNTYGFKSSRATFRDSYYQAMRGAAAATSTRGGTNPSDIGYGAQISSIDVLHEQSTFSNTGNPLDVAIAGEGYLQVQDSDGNIYYTRAGMLDIDAMGNVVDSNGNFVLGVSGNPLGKAADKQKIQVNIPSVNPAPGEVEETINSIKYKIKASNATEDSNVNFTFLSDATLPQGQPAKALLTSSGITIALNATAQFKNMGEVESAINTAIRAANNGADHPAGTFSISADPNVDATKFDNNGKGYLTGAEIAGTNYSYNYGKLTLPPDELGNPAVSQKPYSLFNFKEVGSKFGDGFADPNAPANGVAYALNYVAADKEFTMTVQVDGVTYTGTFSLAAAKDGCSVMLKNGGSLDDSITLQCPSLTTLVDNTTTVPKPTIDETKADLGLPNMAYGGLTVTDANYQVTASRPANDLGLGSKSFLLKNGTEGGAQSVKDLNGISIGADGVISASHPIHGTIEIGRIDLAVFNNDAGLQQSGNTYFTLSKNSGEPSLVKAGTHGSGSLKNSALEQSNVDLSQEFSDMITTQRGFQANSRLITVSDTMLEELINLKR